MSVTILVAWLTLIWVALWGSLTAANVVGGVLVAAAVFVVFPVPTRRAPAYVIRPLATARFVVHFAYKLVEANLVVAWEVVTPRNRINEGIVAVPIAGCSDGLVLILASAIGLTPGTLPLEVDRSAEVMFVHVLHLHDIDEVRRDLQHLELLIVRAFGSPSARIRMDPTAAPGRGS